MSFQKPEKDFGGEGPKVHKIRITLTSRKVQSLEKVCTELLERAKSKNLKVKGPVRLPTKTLKVSKCRSPAPLLLPPALENDEAKKSHTDTKTLDLDPQDPLR